MHPRLKLTLKTAAGYVCAAGWIVSHNMRGCWQARAIIFEHLMVRHQLPAYDKASLVVSGMDDIFEYQITEARSAGMRQSGRETVRESQARTGIPGELTSREGQSLH